METEMNDLFNDRPEGSDEAEAETSFIKDDDDENFNDLLNSLDQNSDDVKTSSFYEENKNSRYGGIRKRINEPRLIGKYIDIEGEFARKVLGSEYQLNPTDGQNSREFISRLDIDEHRLTFDGTVVGFIDTSGTFKVSTNRKPVNKVTNFRNLYEKALKEHKEKIWSVVEEETGGDMLEESGEDIFEDTMEEFHQDVVNANDDLTDQAKGLEGEGKITEQERREFSGITAPKRPPGERIRHIDIVMEEWKSNLEKETDDDRRQITQRAVDVAEQAIDDARLEMGQAPRSDEGKHRYREIVMDNIRTKFERFRVWAIKKTWGRSAIAISIAGIITTVVVARKKTITGIVNGLGATGKVLAKFAKSALPILNKSSGSEITWENSSKGDWKLVSQEKKSTITVEKAFWKSTRICSYTGNSVTTWWRMASLAKPRGKNIQG
ncbi:Hypothetical predicted protein [Paramuricea clavata]|uniref:Uncharacterized protein n=1 Tax=Paramuricea clavata TaxID=317549 RepID=A0A6S7ILM3_PARCT|nr:Hypothetical predicted protein [Paramuricea clavata]